MNIVYDKFIITIATWQHSKYQFDFIESNANLFKKNNSQGNKRLLILMQ